MKRFDTNINKEFYNYNVQRMRSTLSILEQKKTLDCAKAQKRKLYFRQGSEPKFSLQAFKLNKKKTIFVHQMNYIAKLTPLTSKAEFAKYRSLSAQLALIINARIEICHSTAFLA